jgi:hypothetical protein
VMPLTGMDLKKFCVCDYVLLLPTYPMSLRRNQYKIFGLGSKKEMFFAKQSANKLSNSALGDSI